MCVMHFAELFRKRLGWSVPTHADKDVDMTHWIRSSRIRCKYNYVHIVDSW